MFLCFFDVDLVVGSMVSFINRRMRRIGHLNLGIESVPRLFYVISSLLNGDNRPLCVLGVVSFARGAGRDWRC